MAEVIALGITQLRDIEYALRITRARGYGRLDVAPVLLLLLVDVLLVLLELFVVPRLSFPLVPTLGRVPLLQCVVLAARSSAIVHQAGAVVRHQSADGQHRSGVRRGEAVSSRDTVEERVPLAGEGLITLRRSISRLFARSQTVILLLRRLARLFAEQSERPRDHGEGRRVRRKSAEDRRVQAAEQAGVSFGAHGLPQAVPSARVTIATLRLDARLDHVHGIGDHPGSAAGEAARDQHVQRRDRLFRGRPCQYLVRHEVHAVARTFSEKRDAETFENSAAALSSVNLFQTLYWSLRVTPGRGLQLQSCFC